MRILLTVHQFFPKHHSGTEVLTRDTGLEMLGRGHEVHVLTTDPSAHRASGGLGHRDYDYRGLKVHCLELPRPRREDPPVFFREEYRNELVAEHVRGYVQQLRPDVVHMFHLVYLSGAVIGVFRELGVPMVYTTTDFWPICLRGTLAKPSGELSSGPDEISSNCLECRTVERILPPYKPPEPERKQEFYREVAERALAGRRNEHPNMAAVRTTVARTPYLRERFNRMDAILAPTEFMRTMLIGNGIDPELVSVSPYGMDVSGLRGARVAAPQPDSLRIGYIGAIRRWKGLDVLLRALGKLPKDGGTTLRICGDLRGDPKYTREVYDLAGGDPRVNFAGLFPNEEMGAELGKIDVLVVPSVWYENAPLVIYSALAAGVPVVATNLGGMAGLIQHERNGLLFEPGDPEDLASQLRRLAKDPNLLAELGRNGGGVRGVEDSVNEMLELYGRLDERPRTAGEIPKDAGYNQLSSKASTRED